MTIVNSFLGRYTLETGARFIAWWNIVLSISTINNLFIGLVVLISDNRGDVTHYIYVSFPIIGFLVFSVLLVVYAFLSWTSIAGIIARDHNRIENVMIVTSSYVVFGVQGCMMSGMFWLKLDFIWLGLLAGVFVILNIYYYVVLNSLYEIFERERLERDRDEILQVFKNKILQELRIREQQ